MGWLLKLFTGDILGKVIDGISGHFRGKREAREARDAVEAKIRLAQVNRDATLDLAEHELQVLRTREQGGSWKDEYVTILVSVPIIVAMTGALMSVHDPEMGSRLLVAADKITGIMTGESIDFAELWLIVVTVALGTKPFRRS